MSRFQERRETRTLIAGTPPEAVELVAMLGAHGIRAVRLPHVDGGIELVVTPEERERARDLVAAFRSQAAGAGEVTGDE